MVTRRGWSRGRLARLALIATPFVLLALGAWALLVSPWPTILGLTLRGQHVVVAYGWPTVGLGTTAALCFVAALVISFNIRAERR